MNGRWHEGLAFRADHGRDKTRKSELPTVVRRRLTNATKQLSELRLSVALEIHKQNPRRARPLAMEV